MAHQQENIQDPAGLGTILEDMEFVVETQNDGSEEQREVDHLSDEDFTDETEEHTAPLRVIVGNSPADVSEAESQPGSAFSSSSSDEETDADDEGEEEDDEGNDTDQAEEWEDAIDNSAAPPPPAEEIRVLPAVVGRLSYYRDTYNLFRFDNNCYHSSSSDSEQYKKKKRRQEKATSTRDVRRPSPLRTASNPDSPTSPKDKSSAPESGVLPEPSPEAEDAHIVSPLSDHDDEPGRPELVSEQQALAAKRDWSEEDELDTSWVPDAIADVIGPDRESGHDLVSPLEEADDEKIVSLEAPTLDMDDSDEPETAPEGFNPTFITLQPKKFHDPTSPDPDGPEILTGLDPREGFDAWKEWHDRNDVDGQRFRTKYLITDDNGKSGDLNVFDDSDRSDAADFLRKQRLLFKEKKAGAAFLPAIDMVPGNTAAARKADQENIIEFMKIQMLKYRFQRNFFRYEFKICERNLRDSQDRVGRRDETVRELDETVRDLDGIVLRREDMIEKLKLDNAQLLSVLEDTDAAWDSERARRELLQDEQKKLLMFSEQYKKAAQQNAEKLRRNRSERDVDFQMATIMDVVSQSPIESDPADTAKIEAVSILKKQNESLVKDIARIKDDDVKFIQKQSASVLGMKAATEQILQKTFATHEGEKSALEDQVADSHQHVQQLQYHVDDLLKQLDTVTKGKAQAEAEVVQLKLQKKDELEDKLAASRSHTESLRSRKDELEARQANAKLTLDLSDHVKAAKAAEELAQGQIEDLQAQLKAKSEKLATAEKRLTGASDEFGEIGADIAAWQKDYDGMVAELEVGKNTLKGELDAERQESKALRKALLAAQEHNSSPASADISSPLHDTKEQQQLRKAAFSRPSGWVSRENAIMQQSNGASDLKSRLVAREKRQEEELGLLDQIRLRMDSVCSILGMSELSYIPPQGRFLAMVA
jgi:hypothetical protein